MTVGTVAVVVAPPTQFRISWKVSVNEAVEREPSAEVPVVGRPPEE